MRLNTFGLLLLVAGTAAAAAAQTTVSGTLQCGKPEIEQAVPAADDPAHAFSVSKVSCNWTKPMEVGGSQSKTGTSAGVDEIKGDTAKGYGQHVSTMANGEKTFVRYEGKVLLKEGAPQSAEGTWHYTGGTGPFAGIKGKGTYKGKVNPDGTMTYEVEGNYTLPPK